MTDPKLRELDYEVAEKLMGFSGRITVYHYNDRKKRAKPLTYFTAAVMEKGEWVRKDYGRHFDSKGVEVVFTDHNRGLFIVPHYSTDIREAMVVVAKVRKLVSMEVEFLLQANEDGTWEASFGMEESAIADTVEVAICKAALNVVAVANPPSAPCV